LQGCGGWRSWSLHMRSFVREVMRLEEIAAGLRREWTGMNARRPAAVGRSPELLSTLAVGVGAADQVSFDQEDFFPVLVDERHGRKGARLDAQNPGTVADLVLFIERAGENPFGEAGRVSRNVVESFLEVEGGEFHMALVVSHDAFPSVCADGHLIRTCRSRHGGPRPAEAAPGPTPPWAVRLGAATRVLPAP